jgi:hypothetical protein
VGIVPNSWICAFLKFVPRVGNHFLIATMGSIKDGEVYSKSLVLRAGRQDDPSLSWHEAPTWDQLSLLFEIVVPLFIISSARRHGTLVSNKRHHSTSTRATLSPKQLIKRRVGWEGRMKTTQVQ